MIDWQSRHLKLDNGIGKITSGKSITEEQLKEALRPYKLKESLLILADFSRKIFIQDFTTPYNFISNHVVVHPRGISISQYAIEYLANIFLISGANDYKSKSIKDKDNFIGLFNIYNNTLINHNLRNNDISSLLVPLYFEQFRSQRSMKDLFTRQWVIYDQIRNKAKNSNLGDVNDVIYNKTKLSISEIVKLSILIFGHLLKNPQFKVDDIIIANNKIKSLIGILTPEKINAFLNLYSVTYSEFRDLDKKLNQKPLNEFTKTRFNPLWKKPILHLDDDVFLLPSITAYTNAIFFGLFWWFDDYYRNISKQKQYDFRDYFGKLFENYVGELLIDLYGSEFVKPPIKYGRKGYKIDFTDWTVLKKEKTYLFEVKASQFPLEILQQGNPDGIRKEVINKLVEAIRQLYERTLDIGKYPELMEYLNKNVIPIIVFYDIPFVSSTMYNTNIQSALNNLNTKYPGIKDFKYYLIEVEELEEFYCCSDSVEIEDILQVCQNDSSTNFIAEVKKRRQDNNRENFMERNFKAFFKELAP